MGKSTLSFSPLSISRAMNGDSFETPSLGLPEVQSTSGFSSQQDWLVGRVVIWFF